jgi:hypothetical protein
MLKIETEGYFSKLDNCTTRLLTLDLELTYPLKALALKHPPTWPQALHTATSNPGKGPGQLCFIFG